MMTQTKRHITQSGHKNAGNLAKLAALTAFGLAATLVAPSNAATQYAVSGVFSGVSTNGTDINNSGRVVGGLQPSASVNHAFSFNGSTTDLNSSLGNPFGSFATSVNDSGLTTGYFYDAASNYRSFLYSPGSNTSQDLTSAFPVGTLTNLANGINNSGQVVGLFTGPGGTRGFLFTSGAVQDLTSSFAITPLSNYANAINNAGKIVGSYSTATTNNAFYYSNGISTNLNPSLGGTGTAYANSINNSNQVVGQFFDGSQSHGFVWSGGNGQSLKSSLPFGTNYSSAYGINDSGQVVGIFTAPSSFSGQHAFIYSGGVSQDLNNLIPSGSGWVLQLANAINNSGQITGRGSYFGQTRAFVLSLGTVSGSGRIASGNAQFSFNATAKANGPQSSGLFTFLRTGGPFIFNAPIQNLTINGNTANFGGVYVRDKNGNPTTSYNVTIVKGDFFDGGESLTAKTSIVISQPDTFTVRLYSGLSTTPYATYGGPLTSGSVFISTNQILF